MQQSRVIAETMEINHIKTALKTGLRLLRRVRLTGHLIEAWLGRILDNVTE